MGYPIYGLIVDNAPNMLNAVKLLRDDVEACVPHALCFNCGCHVLNLIGHDVTREFLKENGLEDILSELMKLGLAHRVCPTRWWSTVDEFERMANSVDAIATIAQHPKFANIDALRHIKHFVNLQINNFQLIFESNSCSVLYAHHSDQVCTLEADLNRTYPTEIGEVPNLGLLELCFCISLLLPNFLRRRKQMAVIFGHVVDGSCRIGPNRISCLDDCGRGRRQCLHLARRSASCVPISTTR